MTTDPTSPRVPLSQPITAGVVAALVGFTSSFAVVLTGLRAVGASADEAASGLFALCLAMTIGIGFLALRYRMPITLAWSTPGAALLAGTATPDGGFPAAVGAFVLVGVMVLATGLWPRLGALVQAIPTPIAQAMLAGIVLPLCLEPVHAFADEPLAIAPVVLVWLVLSRYAKRWAVPAAFATAAVVIAVVMLTSDKTITGDSLIPRLDLVVPQWSWQACVGIALPLYIVTMASQNLPGTAVMSSFGYRIPWRPSMLVTGALTSLVAPAGGHAVNLSAISAALAAAPAAEPNPRRRWIAAFTVSPVYLVLAFSSAAVVALIAVAPAGLVETVAGLALLDTLAGSLAASLRDEKSRTAAVLTFVVAAAGVTVAGIGSAFWALIAGLIVYVVLRTPPEPEDRRPETPHRGDPVTTDEGPR
ncbi:benzoate/H(+) symporter BenE family transporter [Gordonia rubripertincta]|uniref:Benzoate/H(+) symporter BenE family transporter n=1 Tax=Gordonia rubripertincta TaxID=36822 RepID=A0ABT4N368_GORRU|nr:benzoate/H(+) symporter BenE family transporter [Gordonia rubripertincta]MCZ4553725.1 benzoate/H(+) symporter BenE family transporter [Gordonia rubripertincta]